MLASCCFHHFEDIISVVDTGQHQLVVELDEPQVVLVPPHTLEVCPSSFELLKGLVGGIPGLPNLFPIQITFVELLPSFILLRRKSSKLPDFSFL